MALPDAKKQRPPAVKWLIALLTPLAIIPFVLFTLFCVWVFESGLLPEQELKATTVGTGIKERLEYAVEVGIPFGDLRDMTNFLDDSRVASEQISFIAVTDVNGMPLYTSSEAPDDLRDLVTAAVNNQSLGETDSAASWASRFVTQIFGYIGVRDELLTSELSSPRIGDFYITTLPVDGEQEVLGYLAIGVGVTVLSRVVNDLIFDTATIVLGSFVIAFELLILVITVHLLRPLKLLSYITHKIQKRDLSQIVDVDSYGVVARSVTMFNSLILLTFERLKAIYVGIQTLPAGRRRREARLHVRDILLKYQLPDDGKQNNVDLPALTYIRLPLFLFFLAEALIRPILPVLVDGLDNSALPLSAEMSLGLPFAAFMAASILGVVVGSLLSDKFGARSILVLGTLVSSAALTMHAFAHSIELMAAVRFASGFGYGVVYAAAQVYVVANSDRSKRAGAFSVFLAAVVAAEICGPAIGGIIADRIGFTTTFFVGGGLLILALIFVVSLIKRVEAARHSALAKTDAVPEGAETPAEEPENTEAQKTGGRRQLLFNLRFLVLCGLYAVPAKMILTGAIFFLVPLAAAEFGASASDIGRILMLYGIMIVLTGTFFANLADRYNFFGFNIAFGGVLSGLGLVLIIFSPGLLTLAIAVALIGIGQSMSIPSQLTYALEVGEVEAEKFGVGMVLASFRFVERLGSLFGPIAAAFLLGLYTIPETLMIFGIYAIMSACFASAFFLTFGTRDEDRAIHALLIKSKDKPAPA